MKRITQHPLKWFMFGFITASILSVVGILMAQLQLAKKVPIDFVVLKDTVIETGFIDTCITMYFVCTSYNDIPTNNTPIPDDTTYEPRTVRLKYANTYTFDSSPRMFFGYPTEPLPTYELWVDGIIQHNPGSILIDVANGKVYDLVSTPIKYPEYKVEARERKEAQ